jgi:hypothetical protein
MLGARAMFPRDPKRFSRMMACLKLGEGEDDGEDDVKK